ncbi:MAG: dihydrolipoyl dehydrogenase [Rickettsiales bacterium]|nr:dihydrolipoyl dehydrogenase [Pseudomonadota bacterium]MDA0965514.1 dihydrolipoyl dehydrogenase [Pseudomonadota bacterium]MDG4542838.1 dihydrolipoyl dehydrogenase [Rickettsiales bacterium]MDG4544714.1 dihydrolipoyl dehydrogenase [Rickettsiales bacterium]MDG4546836.1 dihydrolipoyl dehydrogenase [Rickettsiales bacterium]
MNKFDVVVIGGGPGGYVAAIRAAQLGLKTAVVEGNHLGGICLNWGCIPTKALLRSAEVLRTVQHAEEFGITVKDISFDIQKIVKRSREVASQLSGGIGHLMKKNKIEVFDGFGKLNGKGRVKVEKDGKKIADIESPNIIIATGARARTLPGLESDGKQVLTYKEAMIPDDAPKSLLVVGSGAIGIEFASFYNALGVDVTVVEMADRVMPVEDAEISKMARKSFEKQGMKIHTKTTVRELKKSKDGVTAILDSNGKETNIKVDRVITAVGIVPNTEGLGFEGTKVKFDRGHIVTNKWCETDEAGVYAIGDVASAPWLAHKASHEGVVCVEKIAGLNGVHPINKNNIPGCTYCHPQVASVGLTEEKAKDAGHEIKVGRFQFVGNGKAIALGEPEGLVKTIFDAKTGELLGAHLIGAEVTELINGFLVGKTMEATESDFMHTIFPHPTLSEMMHESVLDAFGKVVHM